MTAYLGLWVIAALTLNMWALLSVMASAAPFVHKVVWTFVLLIPVLGFIAWFLIGPRRVA